MKITPICRRQLLLLLRTFITTCRINRISPFLRFNKNNFKISKKQKMFKASKKTKNKLKKRKKKKKKKSKTILSPIGTNRNY